MGLFGAAKPRVPGTIDLHRRPVVRNPDGTISTVRSISIGTDQGEVLIPTVSEDGRVMTDEEAVAQYERTQQHLGIFGTPEEATTYAQSLHGEQAQEYGQRGNGMSLFGTMSSGPKGAVGGVFGAAPKVPSAPRGGGRGFFGRLQEAFSPENIASIQATLAGDAAAQAQLQALVQRRQQEEQEAMQQQEVRMAQMRALQRMGFDKDRIAGMSGTDASQEIARSQRPPEEGEFTRMMRAAGIDPASPQAQQIYRQRVETMANPPVMVQNPDGTVTFMPRPPMAQTGPQAAPQNLPRPRSPQERDALPPGSQYIAPDGSVRTVGGAGSQAPAPFADAGRHRRTAMAESGNRDYQNGRPVRSSAGALYAMQTMPATARDPGFGVTPARNSGPAEFNRVGREYIDAMVREFGSEAAGAAAYNYGPGNFRRLIAQHPNDWRNHLPRETRDYLRRQGF